MKAIDKTIKGWVVGLVLAGLASLASCNVLEVSPADKISATDAISTEAGLLAAINGVYDGLQDADLVQHYTTMAGLLADNLEAVGSKIEYRDMARNTVQAADVYVEGIWNASYDVVNRINNILAALEAGNVSGISTEDAALYTAELRFLRGYVYFQLMRLYGTVPLRTSPINGISDEELNVGRATEAELQAQIRADLEAAATGLSGSGSNLRATEGAAKALLARFALYTEDYAQAVTLAEEVMGLGYALQDGDSYGDIFVEAAASGEIIWQIDFVNDNDVHGLADWFLPTARFEVASNANLYNAFDLADKRLAATIRETGGVYYGAKYEDATNDSDNLVVLRLAEMYLIHAEAWVRARNADLSPAIASLNALRSRAGLADTGASTEAELLTAIANERRLELAFEGHRWFDLIRTGEAIDAIATVTIADQLLMPIPQSELDSNTHPDMTQNPGY